MRWFEYKMEVDNLHASDELKEKLLAMQAKKAQTAEENKEDTASKRKPFVPVVWKRHWKQVTAVAACLAVGFFAGGTITGGGLGSAKTGQNITSLYYEEPIEAQVRRSAAVQEDARAEVLYDMASGTGLQKSGGVLSGGELVQEESQGQKIIYTAWMSIETKQYDETLAKLYETVNQVNGYVESSGESCYEGQVRSTNMTLRIPTAQYRDFLGSASETGNVCSRNEEAQDITASYMDVQARIDTLEQTRSRLLELEAKAESVSELVEIENSLSDIQYQLESSQRQKNYYDRAVSYCTVSISVQEVKEYTDQSESLGERLSHALSDGWETFVEGAESLLIGVVFLLPVLVLVAVGVALFRAFHHRKRKKNQK